MKLNLTNLDRRGISLTEILIGILVLGIGVISLATLFPLGLLKMRQAVHETRGTILARDAVAQVRVRNLLGMSMSTSTGGPWTTPYLSFDPRFGGAPTLGPGAPVVIDPLGLVSDSSFPTLFGQDPVAPATTVGDGLQRVTLAEAGPNGVIGDADDTPAFGQVWLCEMTTSSSDDLSYDEATDRSHKIPLQSYRGVAPDMVTPANPALTPTYGIPFDPGAAFSPGSLPREPRYSWILIARKVTAAQPLGPHAVTAIVFFNRDVTLVRHPGPDGTSGNADDVMLPASEIPLANASGTANPNVFVAGSNTAYVTPRAGEKIPQIPIGGYVMDVTYDSSAADGVPHHAFVYRVIGREVDPTNGQLVLTLDQPARETGTYGLYLKGAVAVFEKQVP